MDGLSGAASVAGIVSLSVQLTESIHKICKFLSAFKHASEDIEDIIDDLEVLSCVIAEIQRCEELFGQHYATSKAILRCQRQAHALERMTTEWKIEMEKDSKWRRGQAAFKSVLNVEKVKEMRVKIGEAKGTLSLALQASNSRAYHTEFVAIVQTVRRLGGQMPQMDTSESSLQSLVHMTCGYDSCLSQTATSSALCSPALRHLPRRIISRETTSWYSDGSWIQSIFGSLSYKHISQTVEGQFSEEGEVAVTLVFEPAWWLQALGLNRLLRAQIERTSRNGWKTSLRPQQLMSQELLDTVDEVISRGDLDSLRTMLCSGEVTIRSVDSFGGNLLHAAAYYSQADICEFLLEAGVDKDDENVYSNTAFDMIVLQPEASRKHQLDTMKVFTAAGEDFMIYDSQFWWFQLFYALRSNEKEPQPPEDPLSWLFQHFCFVASFHDTRTPLPWWAYVVGCNMFDGSDETHLLQIAFRAEISMEVKRWAFLNRLFSHKPWEEEIARIWLSELGCLHFKIQDPEILKTYTLCSRSLGSCWHFSSLQEFFRFNQIPIEEFVCNELPLLQEIDDGAHESWTEEALTALFNWDCSHLTLREMEPWHKECLTCSDSAYWWAGYAGNTLWNLSVKQIKEGKSPDGPFDREEKQLANKWRRYYERSRTEGICFNCMREEEKAHSEPHEDGFEPSPLLLDI